jgi:4,5-dihydroxyphthalate decarboxylase
MGDMLARGEPDAALHYISDRNLVDRSQLATAVPGLRPLFADPLAEGIRYDRKTGLLPVNHCVVIRASLHEQHPWLALNLYSAFLAAKEAAFAPLPEALRPWQLIGTLPADTANQMWQTDPLPYGIRTQRDTLDALAEYLAEQGLVARKVTYDELFAESTLDL